MKVSLSLFLHLIVAIIEWAFVSRCYKSLPFDLTASD